MHRCKFKNAASWFHHKIIFKHNTNQTNNALFVIFESKKLGLIMFCENWKKIKFLKIENFIKRFFKNIVNRDSNITKIRLKIIYSWSANSWLGLILTDSDRSWQIQTDHDRSWPILTFPTRSWPFLTSTVRLLMDPDRW